VNRYDLDAEEKLFQKAVREGREVKLKLALKAYDTYYREMTIYGVRWAKASSIITELFNPLVITYGYGHAEFDELLKRKTSFGGLRTFRTQSAESPSRRGEFLIASKGHSRRTDSSSTILKRLQRAKAQLAPAQLSFQKGEYRNQDNFITVRSGLVASVDERSVLLRSLRGYRRYPLDSVRTVVVGDPDDLDELNVWTYNLKASHSGARMIERGYTPEEVFRFHRDFKSYKA